MAIVAYLGTFLFVCMGAIFALISLVGPHSKGLSEPMTTAVYVVCGLAVLILPAWAAHAVFRASSAKAKPGSGATGLSREGR